MNPISPPPAMDKLVGQTRFFSLGKEKENSEFKPVKLFLKNWPCVISCPSGGVGKYVYNHVPNIFFKLFLWNKVLQPILS